MSSYVLRYQPSNLDELIIDEKIIKPIRLLFDLDDLNILLYGGTGVGKTTIIRCIVEEFIQKYKVTVKDKKSNILFVNSLQDQNIHQFRDYIKTFCQTTCTLTNINKKLIILDDIDTFPESNQQIIRHCMNTYHEKIYFICSCSNIQKVMDNIQSQTNIVKIPPFDAKQLKSLIQKICAEENIQLDTKCCNVLIKISDYLPRVILNNLEKLTLYDKHIQLKHIKNICSNINFDIFDKYTNAVYKKRNFQEAYTILINIYQNGYSVLDILETYYQYIKISNLLGEADKLKLLPYIFKYINVFYSIHEDEFELILFTNEILNLFIK